MNENRLMESISPYIKLTKIWCSMLAVIMRKINVSSAGYRKHFFPDRSFIPVDYSAGTEGDATRQGVVPRTISMAPFYVCTIVHRWLDYVPGTFSNRGSRSTCCLNRPLHDNSRCNARFCEIVSDSVPSEREKRILWWTQDHLTPRVSTRCKEGP